MELQELLQVSAAILAGFLVTEGIKSLNGAFGQGKFDGFAPAMTAFFVVLFVTFGQVALGYIPAEYAGTAANIAKSILAVLSAFGIHRTAQRMGSIK